FHREVQPLRFLLSPRVLGFRIRNPRWNVCTKIRPFVRPNQFFWYQSNLFRSAPTHRHESSKPHKPPRFRLLRPHPNKSNPVLCIQKKLWTLSLLAVELSWRELP